MHDTATETQTKPIPQLKADFIHTLAAVNDTAEMVKPLDQALEEKLDAIRKSHYEQHAETYHIAQAAGEAMASAEKVLRDSVIAHFEATGEKTIDENLGVRVNSRFEYENDEAVEWAEKNAPVMIYRTVDKKAFESYSKVTDLPFVRKIETASAVIKGLK